MFTTLMAHAEGLFVQVSAAVTVEEQVAVRLKNERIMNTDRGNEQRSWDRCFYYPPRCFTFQAASTPTHSPSVVFAS